MMRKVTWVCVGINLFMAAGFLVAGAYGSATVNVIGAVVGTLCQIISELSPEKPPRQPPKTNSTAYLVTDNPYQAPQQS